MRSSPYRPHPAFTTQEHIDEITRHQVQFVIDPKGPSKFRLKSMETKEHWIVGIGSEQTCTCHDPEVCLHILYIMMRYFGVPKECDILWQKSLTDHEIDIVLDGRVKRQPQAKPQPIYKTKSGKSKVKRLPIGEEDVCPICYDSLTECDKSKIAWCRLGCGGNFHRKCVKSWIESQRNSGKDPLCPICRQRLDMLGINPPPKKPPANAPPPLSESEIRDLMNREITPDDYDLLLKLDQCPNCTTNHQPIRRNPISNQQRRIQSKPNQNQNQRLQAANRILRDQLDLQVTGTTVQQDNPVLPTREQQSRNRQVVIRRVNQNQNRRPVDPNLIGFMGEVTGNHISPDNSNENIISHANSETRIYQRAQRPHSQLPSQPQQISDVGRIITGIGNLVSTSSSDNGNIANAITPPLQPQIKTPAPWHGGGGGNNRVTSKRNIVIPPKRAIHLHSNHNANGNESPQFLVSNFNMS